MITMFGRRIELAAPIRIRPAAACGACSDRGWFYTISTVGGIEPPDGCTGVALCGCGIAAHHTATTDRQRRRTHRRTVFYSRMGWRRRVLLAVTLGHLGRGKPPF